jgi:4-amino-4-deoxy-L-arabinose transferase-like glycosyltransferase
MEAATQPQAIHSDEPGTQERRRFLLVAFALTLLALALRQYYLLGGLLTSPFNGDAIQYWTYGWNLAHHGVFSMQPPSPVAPSPDSWRSPGFPLLLALSQRLGGSNAVAWAQWQQVLLGTGMVPLAIALARLWLSRSFALWAGLLTALWPHLVVFSTVLFSEIPFGFALLLASLLIALGERRGSVALAALAGLAAGAAALVNSLFLLFPPLLVLLLVLRGRGRVACAYGLAFALLAGAWSLRNATLPEGASSADRVGTNLVQGSWPLYHAAWNNREREPMAAEYMKRIDADTVRMSVVPYAATADLLARLRSEPGEYLRWYLLEKPWLLLDWDIRIGAGDIYVTRTLHSPFERVPALRGLHDGARAINPLLFALALAGVAWTLWRAAKGRWRDPAGFAPMQLALLCGYLVAVHVVLQSEPRYGIAYRPLEFLLALEALSLSALWLRARRSRGS